MVAGVAAGVADYLGLDVAVVRIVLLVLVIMGGFGLALYVAGWLLMPDGDGGTGLAQAWLEARPGHRNRVVLAVGVLLGVLAVSDLVSTGPWWPHFGGGLGFFAGVAAVLVVASLLAGTGRYRRARSRLGWLFGVSLGTAGAVLVVAVATLFSAEALSGVPLRGGVGDSQWQPTAADQVAPQYRLAMGNLVVDLTGVAFRPGTVHLTTTVGIGRVLVEIPPGPTVEVRAHSGVGAVVLFGQGNGGLGTQHSATSTGTGSTVIVLDAEAGVGQVQVVRAQVGSTDQPVQPAG